MFTTSQLLKTSGSIAALAFFLALPAGAADVNGRGSTKDADAAFDNVKTYNWSGVYIGAHAGIGNTVIGADDGQGGIDLNGILGGLRVGADIQRGPVVVGVWGEYNWSDQSLELFGTTLLEQTSDWSGNARLGYAHGATLFYGFGGYGQAEFASGPNTETAQLWRAGVGIEHKFSNEITFGLEYARNWIDADDLFGEGAEDDLDITEDRVMGVLRYKLNSSTFGF